MLTDAVVGEIKRDVASFADPGTLVEVSSKGQLRWVKDRKDFFAQLVRKHSGFPDVAVDGRTLEYTGFLASEALADLKDLATSIQTQIAVVDNFVVGPAADYAEKKYTDAGELILNESVQPASLPFGSTRVLFVHGNAGSGKTALLRHITRLQAERYVRGETPTLLLYLDAQGKGLSQLEDVMARALQDLRARFTYHSLAPLTRHHCLVPIVDGFDELIGPSSAREAFGNLAQFLSQLDCTGAVITSSRSAFIDYPTLHERARELAAPQGLSYEIYPIEMLPWPNDIVHGFAKQRLNEDGVLASKVDVLLDSPAGGLVQKPFFLAQICQILGEGEDVSTEEDLVKQVVDAALKREATKLRDRHGKPLLSPDQHREFCEAIAEEMWWQEKPELDTETVMVIAEIFGDDVGLVGQDAKLFKDRSKAHGLLVVTTGAGEGRAFEHELFRFEFQASQLASALLGQESDLSNYLLRRELPPEMAERTAVYRRFSSEEMAQVLAKLGVLARGLRTNPYAASNTGTLTAALIRTQSDTLPSGVTLDSVHFRWTDFGECKLQQWTFRGCILERVILSSVRFIECQVVDTLFVTCRLGTKTRFDGTKVDPATFAGIELAGEGETYEPGRIGKTLYELGADVGEYALQLAEPTKEVSSRVVLFENLLKHARNHFYWGARDSWVQKHLLSDPEWPALETMLLSHSILEEVRPTKSGRPEKFWRLSAPPDTILRARSGASGSSQRLEAFWRELTST